MLLFLLPASARAQTDLGLRVGAADGSTGFLVLEALGRTSLGSRWSGAARAHVTQSPGVCDAVWPGSYRCGFAGWGVEAGPALNILRSARGRVDALGTVGLFRRTGDGFDRESSLSWTAGADASLRLTERYGVSAAIYHRRVRDSMHRELFGEDAHATAFAIGLLISL